MTATPSPAACTLLFCCNGTQLAGHTGRTAPAVTHVDWEEADPKPHHEQPPAAPTHVGDCQGTHSPDIRCACQCHAAAPGTRAEGFEQVAYRAIRDASRDDNAFFYPEAYVQRLTAANERECLAAVEATMGEMMIEMYQLFDGNTGEGLWDFYDKWHAALADYKRLNGTEAA